MSSQSTNPSRSTLVNSVNIRRELAITTLQHGSIIDTQNMPVASVVFITLPAATAVRQQLRPGQSSWVVVRTGQIPVSSYVALANVNTNSSIIVSNGDSGTLIPSDGAASAGQKELTQSVGGVPLEAHTLYVFTVGRTVTDLLYMHQLLTRSLLAGVSVTGDAGPPRRFDHVTVNLVSCGYYLSTSLTLSPVGGTNVEKFYLNQDYSLDVEEDGRRQALVMNSGGTVLSIQPMPYDARRQCFVNTDSHLVVRFEPMFERDPRNDSFLFGLLLARKGATRYEIQLPINPYASTPGAGITCTSTALTSNAVYIDDSHEHVVRAGVEEVSHILTHRIWQTRLDSGNIDNLPDNGDYATGMTNEKHYIIRWRTPSEPHGLTTVFSAANVLAMISTTLSSGTRRLFVTIPSNAAPARVYFSGGNIVLTNANNYMYWHSGVRAPHLSLFRVPSENGGVNFFIEGRKTTDDPWVTIWSPAGIASPPTGENVWHGNVTCNLPLDVP